MVAMNCALLGYFSPSVAVDHQTRGVVSISRERGQPLTPAIGATRYVAHILLLLSRYTYALDYMVI